VAMTLPELATAVKARALELGFDACGIAPPAGLPELEVLPEWLARGYAGEMAYLSRTAAQRASAHGALPSAQSDIVTATLYNSDRPYSVRCQDPSRAHVSRYAWGDDYHKVVMRRLDRLIAWMHEVHPETFEATPYVDTGPVQERAFARHAGIGWIGKNCCVINPELGSFIFLSEIICSLPLAPDTPAFDQCGSCSLCLDACPTEALVAPGVLDARRCISYLTIEQRGEIPDELRADVGTRVYGCDICQDVCPYNAKAPISADPAWQPRTLWDRPMVDDLLHVPDAELRASLVDSAMLRAKVAGLRRNFKLAAENAPASRTISG
jgi:epoxyqueuosine reductase